MTKEKLERAMEINARLNELDDILRKLNEPCYDHFRIHGVDMRNQAYYITDLPTEAVVMLRNWYSDQWGKLKEEFEAL
jgi:hypothetical protein